MDVFPLISLIGSDESAFALETPVAEACYQYILRHCDPSHCVVSLEIGG